MWVMFFMVCKHRLKWNSAVFVQPRRLDPSWMYSTVETELAGGGRLNIRKRSWGGGVVVEIPPAL